MNTIFEIMKAKIIRCSIIRRHNQTLQCNRRRFHKISNQGRRRKSTKQFNASRCRWYIGIGMILLIMVVIRILRSLYHYSLLTKHE